LIVFSVLIPFGTFAWVAVQAMSGKPFGERSTEFKLYAGSIRNGELWFPIASVPVKSDRGPKWQLRRLDLADGAENDTPFTFYENSGFPVWVGSTLYLDTATVIYRAEGTSLVPLTDTRFPTPRRISPPFQLDGVLTTVEHVQGNRFRLAHWEEDAWKPGKEFPLPGRDLAWYDDPEHYRVQLLPRASAEPLPTHEASDIHLDVIQETPEVHLMLSMRQPNFAAYRKGFEFFDEDGAEVSALVPENASATVSGWEPVDTANDNQNWVQMTCDRNGPLFREIRNHVHRVVFRDGEGHCEALQGQFEQNPTRPDLDVTFIAADQAEENAYIVRFNRWGTASIGKIDGSHVQPVHAVFAGCDRQYLARWQRIGKGLVLAWLIHCGMIAFSTIWLIRRDNIVLNSETSLPVPLASVWRRLMANAIDLLLILFPQYVIGLFCLSQTFDRVRWPRPTQLADMLLSLELYLYSAAKHSPTVAANISPVSFDSLAPWFESMPQDINVWQLMLLALVIQFGIMSLVEGRFGWTVGSWLAGIRTKRLSQQPIGAFRAFIRYPATLLDLTLLITPLPLAISLVLSRSRRSIGDRLAGAVVVLPTRSAQGISNPYLQVHI